MYTKEQKLTAIQSYLRDGWDGNAPMENRVEYMMREASTYANGHPEWSDIYGADLKPIDEVNKNDLKKLIDEYLKLN